METNSRITVDPKQMGGVPCIRNLRMPVATILGMLADGLDEEAILKEHPELEREDIRAVLRYVAEFFRLREFPLAV